MQGVAEVGGCDVTLVHVAAVAFVYHYSVGNLHYASLDALQLVAGSCKLDEEEEVYHGMTGCLALPHSHGLHENLVVAGCLA